MFVAGAPSGAPRISAGWRACLTALAILAALVVGCAYVRAASLSVPSFDGAMNLNVARSVAAGYGYGFHYGSFFAFPAQTDGPFILPAAAIFALFGISPATCEAVPVLYLAGFSIALLALLRQASCPAWLRALALLACLLMPGMGMVALDGYGEIPMLSWYLGGLLAGGAAMRQPGRRVALGSGLCLSLALLTKLVAALCVAPAAILLALALGRSRSWGALAALVAGLLLPVVAWEVFRFAMLGAAGWTGWWRGQFFQVGRQSGAAELPPPGAWAGTALRHLRSLAGLTGTLPLLLILWLVLPWLAATATLRREPSPARRLLIGSLLVSAACYMLWWLCIVPDGMAWLRRILPGLLLQAILLVTLCGPRGRTPLATTAMAGLAVSSILLFRAGGLPYRAPEVRREIVAAAARLRALPPDAVIFGIGWWQAPQLTLLSGRNAENLYCWTPDAVNRLPHAYVVLDGAARFLATRYELADLRATAELAPIASGPEVEIDRIVHLDPVRPLEAPGLLEPEFDPGRDRMPHAAGWYSAEGVGAWVQPDSRIRLLRTSQRRLILHAILPDGLFAPGPQGRRQTRTLTLALGDTLQRRIALAGPGPLSLDLPLGEPPPGPTPVTLTMQIDGSVPIVHQLDADTRLRSMFVQFLGLR